MIEGFVRLMAIEYAARAEDRRGESPAAALAYDRVARELMQRSTEYLDQELTYEDAAEESGYHPDALRRLRAEGRWTKTRRDLPRRPRNAPGATKGTTI